MKTDYLVIGSGLTGATIARMLHDAGHAVLVVERRTHLGGNVHDHIHQPSGMRIHTYGPHYFRTGSESLWRFVNRFSDFYSYEAVIQTLVDGRCENWPVAASYVRRVVGEHWKPEFQGRPTNFEEASLAKMPLLVYEKFVKGYTEKQWGVPANSLSADLAGRFDVRKDDDPRLKRVKYQAIPVQGYAVFLKNMLEGIPTLLGFDYLGNRERIRARKRLVFTGPIDEFFGFELGRLTYRGQQRDHRFLSDTERAQPCGQVNHPDVESGPTIRTLEWKHMLSASEQAKTRGTVLTTETPFTPSDPDQYEYPFPDEENQRLYQRYRAKADRMPGLLVCGRLGEFRYYDMDQAIGRAMKLARRILGMDSPPSSGTR